MLLTFGGFYSSAVLWVGTLSALTLVPLPMHSIFFVIKLTLLTHLVYFVILMHLRAVCILCGAISFSSQKAAIKMTVYFRIHGVLEFREYSAHIFIYTLNNLYAYIYI